MSDLIKINKDARPQKKVLGREENIIVYNVMLKALNPRVPEHLKNSMTMTGKGSPSLITLYTCHR